MIVPETSARFNVFVTLIYIIIKCYKYIHSHYLRSQRLLIRWYFVANPKVLDDKIEY
ncbi:hypothetical protein RhiirC2_726541 [Rhizophagus irregularis]|uniref:Uncharacterized protein n=1 Tax=Rhizophagus irregularis TaxID=588596 RepID=A0A2N1P0J7_9GLOM|nr:hypothetical protein RhiirC2_726541 [Rhizophagus irregularis]